MIFVEQSRGGSLAQAIRNKMEALATMLGFRFRGVERAGSSLASLLSNKNPWKGTACGRAKCHTCRQNTEKLEQCTKSNVVYESRCVSCNGQEKGKDDINLKESRELPSIYVGETSRSLMERTQEHHRDYEKNTNDSHMVKH